MTVKRKLMITGVSGLLGGNLARHFVGKYCVTGVYNSTTPTLSGVGLIQKDLSKKGAWVAAAFDDYSPDVIIHCAGEANVDVCEKDPGHAERQIFGITKSVSEFARKNEAHLISISTDAVSDGSTEYLAEDDVLNPVNVYGQIKVRTERYLLSEHPSAMIVRTRFYGINAARNTSFTELLIRELSQGRAVTCFVDNFCTQIYVLNLAEVLEECVKKELCGIFNIVEDKKYSRFEYARLVARAFGFDEELIVSCRLSDYRTMTPRPRDTSLSNAKIKATIETEILSTAEGLAKLAQDYRRWR